MIYTEIDVLAFFLLFLDKACSQTSAPSVDHGTTLFPLDRWVKTQVLSTSQP